jgi:hypothetical protein
MSDLVERLRLRRGLGGAERAEAADEIERLRSVANRGGHLAVANAEIERLRGLLREWVVMLDAADFPETFVEAVVTGKPSLVDKTNEAIGRIAETGGWGWED